MEPRTITEVRVNCMHASSINPFTDWFGLYISPIGRTLFPIVLKCTTFFSSQKRGCSGIFKPLVFFFNPLMKMEENLHQDLQYKLSLKRLEKIILIKTDACKDKL